MRKVSGFTLIELVAVIAILAILAVTALPKFFDLRQDAVNASAAGVAGGIASGSTINFAKRLTTNAGYVTVTACDAATVNQLIPGGLPTGYTVASISAPGNVLGTAGTCSLTATTSGVSSIITTFVLIATP